MPTRHAERRRALAVMALTLLAGAACAPESTRLPPMPSDRARPFVEPELDTNKPFDFRLARVRPEKHLSQERLCDLVFVGASEVVTRRNGRHYPVMPAARRLVRCASEAAESNVDLIFMPDARSFVDTIEAGTRLRVQIVAQDGGFENATVASFVAVLAGARNIVEPRPPLEQLPVGDDITRFAKRAGAPERLRCAVAYARPLERITEARAAHYPRGAHSHSLVACHGPRGDVWVDVLFTSRSAILSLGLLEGEVVRLDRLHPDGGEGDSPMAAFHEGG